MKFFFKEFRTAIGVAQIFRGIAARADLHAHRAALERGVEIRHALPMRMIQSFRDAKNRSQPADHVIQRSIRGVMPGGIRLPIVIANHRRDDGPVSTLKARNVSVERKVLAVFVMPTVADHVADIVEQRAGFE